MQIIYRSKKIEKACTQRTFAEKLYSVEMAEKLQMRIDQIQAVDSVETMVRFRIGRCHQLQGKRREQFAVDLIHPFRLVFELLDCEEPAVKIVEIVDYH